MINKINNDTPFNTNDLYFNTSIKNFWTHKLCNFQVK